ncbi:MAG: hypothetical protein IPG35_18245 [Flavobacteriales bacterium]|nr:hypothetical protein [Flavobacteriales bacterium]
MEDLLLLPNPIHSRKPRRLLFVPTTLAKLVTAPEINFLFNDSPLENLLWTRLMDLGIPSERQYEVVVGPARPKLDIAVFCKECSSVWNATATRCTCGAVPWRRTSAAATSCRAWGGT